MTTLPQEFDGNRDQKGYKFKVLERSGRVCLLEKWNPGHKSGQTFYEVVIVQSEPERRFPDGRVVPAHERMPSPEEWGLHAWSPFDLAAAQRRFKQAVVGLTKTRKDT